MHTRSTQRRILEGLATLVILSLLAGTANASHAWGTFHWARTTNPFQLHVGDNVSGVWDGHLDVAISDWNSPKKFGWNGAAPLILLEDPNGTKTQNCKPTRGKIEVCNAAYGTKGWIGIAQIWVKGDHITQATAKMNDTYFTLEYYSGFDNPAAALAADRQLVMCQEIGHGFGLDHNDENFDNPNTGTCMDYGNSPFGDEHPNAHDFEQIAFIYQHLDSTTTVGASGPGKPKKAQGEEIGNDPKNWGQVVRRDSRGRPSLYRKGLGRIEQVFTFVLYADTVQGQQAGSDTAGDGKKANKGKDHGGKRRR